MIRINLIGEAHRSSTRAGNRMPLGQKVTLAGCFIVMVTTMMVGWRWWAVGEVETQLSRQVDVARREEQRLTGEVRQLAELESERTLLRQHVALIDGLRRSQMLPVHLIDQVGRSLPDSTWLTRLKQDHDSVTIEGHCLSLTSLSDFVRDLEATRHFKRPVEIVLSEIVSGQHGAPDLIHFTIKGAFQIPGHEQQRVRPQTPGDKIG